jgi:hypothetical protein
VPDLVPVVRYEDGAIIARVLTTKGWLATILPLWERKVRDWRTVPLPGADYKPPIKISTQRLFVYIDPTGTPQAVLMVTEQPAYQAAWGKPPAPMRARINDLGGPQLGPITGVARRRVLGFIYGVLFPEDYNPIAAHVRTKLHSPVIFADSTFSRKKTGAKTKLRQLIKGYPNNFRRLVPAADSLMKAKNIRPWGWESLKFDHNLHAETLRFFTSHLRWSPKGAVHLGVGLDLAPTWDRFDANYRAAMTADQQAHFDTRRDRPPPRWVAYLYRKIGRSDADHATPFQILGTSNLGPFEALVDAGLFLPESKLDDWLEREADFTGEQRSQVEAYILLDEPSPINKPHDEFVAWAANLTEAW